MLLLRDVHYALYHGVCRSAFVADDGAALDTVDLHVDLEMIDLWHGLAAEPPSPFEAVRVVRGACYDARGAVGTWHCAAECPRSAIAIV